MGGRLCFSPRAATVGGRAGARQLGRRHRKSAESVRGGKRTPAPLRRGSTERGRGAPQHEAKTQECIDTETETQDTKTQRHRDTNTQRQKHIPVRSNHSHPRPAPPACAHPRHFHVHPFVCTHARPRRRHGLHAHRRAATTLARASGRRRDSRSVAGRRSVEGVMPVGRGWWGLEGLVLGLVLVRASYWTWGGDGGEGGYWGDWEDWE